MPGTGRAGSRSSSALPGACPGGRECCAGTGAGTGPHTAPVNRPPRPATARSCHRRLRRSGGMAAWARSPAPAFPALARGRRDPARGGQDLRDDGIPVRGPRVTTVPARAPMAPGFLPRLLGAPPDYLRGSVKPPGRLRAGGHRASPRRRAGPGSHQQASGAQGRDRPSVRSGRVTMPGARVAEGTGTGRPGAA